jgi:hypothetical protein
VHHRATRTGPRPVLTPSAVEPSTATPPDALVEPPPGPVTGSIIDQHPVAARVTITHERTISGIPAEALWKAYEENFGPLQDLAMLRHVDTREDFLDQLANPRIVKIVGWRGDLPVGLAMVTNSLEDVTEISPQFLRARFPEQAARDAIYFGTLVMVSQPLRGRTLFSRLTTELWQIPANVGGVLIFDVCEFNRTNFDTDVLAQRIAGSFPRSNVQVVDRQTWYAAELPEPIAGRPST